jgi:hypothetical protein
LKSYLFFSLTQVHKTQRSIPSTTKQNKKSKTKQSKAKYEGIYLI